MLLSEEQRLAVECALAELVGLPLTDMMRYAETQKFEFGEQKPHVNSKGEEVAWADWGMEASCDWQINGPNGFLLSHEYFVPTREDNHADTFYGMLEIDPPVVESVVVLDNGALRIGLTGEYSIAIDPKFEEHQPYQEWRFMPKEGDPRGHLVLSPRNVSWSGQ